MSCPPSYVLLRWKSKRSIRLPSFPPGLHLILFSQWSMSREVFRRFVFKLFCHCDGSDHGYRHDHRSDNSVCPRLIRSTALSVSSASRLISTGESTAACTGLSSSPSSRNCFDNTLTPGAESDGAGVNGGRSRIEKPDRASLSPFRSILLKYRVACDRRSRRLGQSLLTF